MLTTDKCMQVHHHFAHEDTIQQFTTFWRPIYFGGTKYSAENRLCRHCKALQFTKYSVKVFYVYKKENTKYMTNCILKNISKYFVTIVFKIHCKILKMYLNYYLKYMYFKILPITANVHKIVQIHSETGVSVSSLSWWRAVTEALRQFAPPRDDCTLELLDCSESSPML